MDQLTVAGIVQAVKARLKDVVQQYVSNNPVLLNAVQRVLEDESDVASLDWLQKEVRATKP